MLFKKKERIEEVVQFSCSCCGKKNVKVIVVNDNGFLEKINKRYNMCESCGYVEPNDCNITYDENEEIFENNEKYIKNIMESDKPKHEKILLNANASTIGNIDVLYDTYEYYKYMKKDKETLQYANMLYNMISAYDAFKFLMYEDEINSRNLKRCMKYMCILSEVFYTRKEYDKTLLVISKYKDFPFNDTHKYYTDKMHAVKRMAEKALKKK